MSIQTKTMKVKSDTALAETTTIIRDTVTFDVSKMPNGITYKGLKAVLSFADPIQWNKASTYDALTVVWDDASHGSYVSKRPVPSNIELTNEFYWLRTADLDAQVEMYRQEVQQFDSRITANAEAIAAETARAENEETSISNKLYYVTPEEFGASGDGVADDTIAFKAALNSGASVFLKNKYLINEIDISGYDNVYIFSDSSTNTYLGTTHKGIIKFKDNCGFISHYINNSKSYTFENITFENGYINGTWNLTAINCAFNGMKYISCHNAHISGCTFNKCEYGVKQCDDSTIIDSYFNQCETGILTPNSSIVSHCTIQWCNIGIDFYDTKPEYGVLNTLVNNNRFDRNNVAINNDLINEGLIICNNMFRRSVNYHIQGRMAFSLIGNKFIRDNSEDDDTGSEVPASPFKLDRNHGYSMFSNNVISGTATNKFNDSSWSEEGKLIGDGNLFNNHEIGVYTKSGTGIVSDGKLEIDVVNFNGYDVRNPICRLIKEAGGPYVTIASGIYMDPIGSVVKIEVPSSLFNNGDSVNYDLSFNKPIDYIFNNAPIVYA